MGIGIPNVRLNVFCSSASDASSLSEVTSASSESSEGSRSSLSLFRSGDSM